MPDLTHKKILTSLTLGMALAVFMHLAKAGEKAQVFCEGEQELLKQMQPAFDQKEFDPNEKDEEGKTIVHGMANKGCLSIVKVLEGKGAKLDLADINGVTPLFGAAISGNTGLVSYLLDKGANINHQSKDKLTVLDVVSMSGGKKDVIELLKKKGAKPGEKGKQFQEMVEKAPPAVGEAVNPANMECMNSCQGLEGQAAQQCYMSCAQGARDKALPSDVQGGGAGAADSMMSCLQKCQGGSPEAAAQCAQSCTGQ